MARELPDVAVAEELGASDRIDRHGPDSRRRARDLRTPPDRRRRPLPRGAEFRLCRRGPGRLARSRPRTVIGHPGTRQRCRRSLHQRHGRARRGLRRHVRGRSGACRRVIVPAVLAACEAEGRTGDATRCAVSPSASRRFAGSASSCPRPCTRRASTRPPSSAPWQPPPASPPHCDSTSARPSTRSASPAAWPVASSSIWPKAPGPSACIRGGRRSRACAPPAWPRSGSAVRARYSRACTDCSTASRVPRAATGKRWSTASARHWLTPTLAFKPYPCGTMIQPYIDCALKIRRRGRARRRRAVDRCGDGRGHPAPAVGAAASQAAAAEWLCGQVRHALLHRRRRSFTAQSVSSISPTPRSVTRAYWRLAAEGGLRRRPDQPISAPLTPATLACELADGRIVEERQSDLRGGGEAPLSRAEIEAKFMANARHGGWSEARADGGTRFGRQVFDGPRRSGVRWRE